MDNKVTKKRISDHLEYDWFKYVLILLASVFIMYFVFDMINKDKDYEELNIFITAYSSEEAKKTEFNNNFMVNMNTKMDKDIFGEDVIRSTSLNVHSVLEKEYYTLLRSQGEVTSDILIIGKSEMENRPDSEKPISSDNPPYGSAYVEFSESLLRIINPSNKNIELYTFNSKAYALRIDNFKSIKDMFGFNPPKKEGEENPDPAFDTEFYLIINPKSVNISGFGQHKSKNGNAQALYFIKTLIDVYA